MARFQLQNANWFTVASHTLLGSFPFVVIASPFVETMAVLTYPNVTPQHLNPECCHEFCAICCPGLLLAVVLVFRALAGATASSRGAERPSAIVDHQ